MRHHVPQLAASTAGAALTLTAAAAVTASTARRSLGGTVVRYGEYGRTSAGLLRVRGPGSILFPDDLGAVKLTREHDRGESRGHLVEVSDTDAELYVLARVSDGDVGDAALQEAADRTRDGFSFDLVDVVLDGDEIVSARCIAIGQVGIPAYDASRIDQIAAATSTTTTTATSTTTTGSETRMTPEQIARLAALLAQETRTPEEEEELAQLVALAGGETAAAEAAATDDPPAATAATASAATHAAVPVGTPARTATVQVRESGAAQLQKLYREVTAALTGQGGDKVTALTAALQDITHSAHSDNVDQIAWSGQLWSGLEYVPEFSDLLTPDTLTNWEGKGWRFTSKLEIQDYAGDKAEIPSDNVTTEPSTYEAARMAVGVDIDRKFYDFPSPGFVEGLFEQVRESWEIKKDAKARAYITSAAVPVESAPGVPVAETTVLKAAARAAMALKRRRVGRPNWVVMNDEDLFTLMDVAEDQIPAFLNLWGVKPEDFRSSQDVPAGTVLAGVRQTAKLRTLPGSPIRVSAQHLANGGVDEAFFGYWAIEEHHAAGIASVEFAPA